MATASCVCCGILGCQIINQQLAPLARQTPAQRRIVTYNMGHGQTTNDEAVARKGREPVSDRFNFHISVRCEIFSSHVTVVILLML